MALENSPTVGHFAHPQHQSCFHLRLKILIPKIYESHIPEPWNDCVGPGIHFYGCFGNLIQMSPDLFLGKPGDLHNLIDAAALKSQPLARIRRPLPTLTFLTCSRCSLKHMDGYYKNKNKNSKRSMHFCSVAREGVNPENLFAIF